MAGASAGTATTGSNGAWERSAPGGNSRSRAAAARRTTSSSQAGPLAGRHRQVPRVDGHLVGVDLERLGAGHRRPRQRDDPVEHGVVGPGGLHGVAARPPGLGVTAVGHVGHERHRQRVGALAHHGDPTDDRDQVGQEAADVEVGARRRAVQLVGSDVHRSRRCPGPPPWRRSSAGRRPRRGRRCARRAGSGSRSSWRQGAPPEPATLWPVPADRERSERYVGRNEGTSAKPCERSRGAGAEPPVYGTRAE